MALALTLTVTLILTLTLTVTLTVTQTVTLTSVWPADEREVRGVSPAGSEPALEGLGSCSGSSGSFSCASW